MNSPVAFEAASAAPVASTEPLAAVESQDLTKTSAPAPTLQARLEQAARQKSKLPPWERMELMLAEYEHVEAFSPKFDAGKIHNKRLPTSSARYVGKVLNSGKAAMAQHLLRKAQEAENVSAHGLLTQRLQALRDATSVQLLTARVVSSFADETGGGRRRSVDCFSEESVWAAVECGHVAFLSARWLCKPGSKLAKRDALPPNAFIGLEDVRTLYEKREAAPFGGGRKLLPVIAVSHARARDDSDGELDPSGELFRRLAAALRERLPLYEHPRGRNDARKGFTDMAIFVPSCCLATGPGGDATEAAEAASALLFAHALTTVYVLAHDGLGCVPSPRTRRGAYLEGATRLRPYLEDGRCVFELQLARLTKTEHLPQPQPPPLVLDERGPDAPPVPVFQQIAATLRKNSARALDLFRGWGMDGDDEIALKDFRRAMSALGLNVPQEDVDALFIEWDRGDGGALTFRELQNILRALPAGPNDVQPRSRRAGESSGLQGELGGITPKRDIALPSSAGTGKTEADGKDATTEPAYGEPAVGAPSPWAQIVHLTPKSMPAHAPCLAAEPTAFLDGNSVLRRQQHPRLCFRDEHERDLLERLYRRVATDVLHATESLILADPAFDTPDAPLEVPLRDREMSQPTGDSPRDDGDWVATQLATLSMLLPYCHRLHTLSLRGRWGVRELPSAVGKLPTAPRKPWVPGMPMRREEQAASVRLQNLDLSGCGVHTLPDNFGRLRELRTLHLDWCLALQRLPETLGELHALRELKLTGCDLLRHLPQSLGTLPLLQRLTVDLCSSLVSLPARLGSVRSLSHLSAYGCRSLRRLPPGLERLPNLQQLRIGGCTQLGFDAALLAELDELEKLGIAIERPHPLERPAPPPFSYRTELARALDEVQIAHSHKVAAAVHASPDARRLHKMKDHFRLRHGVSDVLDEVAVVLERSEAEKADADADAAWEAAAADIAMRPHHREPWPIDVALALGTTIDGAAWDAAVGDAVERELPCFLKGSGIGRVELPDGAVYEGPWRDGKQHDKGTYTFPPHDGRVYTGAWKYGRMHGNGLFRFGENNQYAGEFVDGIIEGTGTRWYPDGSSYAGTWRRGKREGLGKLTLASGDVFEGTWHSDMRHGSGTYYFADGASYDGEWQHDEYMDSKPKGPVSHDREENELDIRARTQATNDELRSRIVDRREALPLVFRRPKTRRSVNFLRSENAELYAYMSRIDHEAFVGRISAERDKSSATLAELEEAKRAAVTPRARVEEIHVNTHAVARGLKHVELQAELKHVEAIHAVRTLRSSEAAMSKEWKELERRGALELAERRARARRARAGSVSAR